MSYNIAEAIQYVDIYLLNLIQNFMVSKILDNFMIVFTTIGNMGVIWIIYAVFLAFDKVRRKYVFIMIIALILCLLLGNLFMKNFFCRQRPFISYPGKELLIPAPKDFSFPSSHAMSSFCASTIIYKSGIKTGGLSILLACLISFSRLYLYVHYPSDVLVGALIGTIIALGVMRCYNRINPDIV